MTNSTQKIILQAIKVPQLLNLVPQLLNLVPHLLTKFRLDFKAPFQLTRAFFDQGLHLPEGLVVDHRTAQLVSNAGHGLNFFGEPLSGRSLGQNHKA